LFKKKEYRSKNTELRIVKRVPKNKSANRRILFSREKEGASRIFNLPLADFENSRIHEKIRN